MIRFLVRFAHWLDKRFPPKVRVTTDNWEALNRRVLLLEERVSYCLAGTNEIRGHQDRRISQLEAHVSLLRKQKDEVRPEVNGSSVSAVRSKFIASGDLS